MMHRCSWAFFSAVVVITLLAPGPAQAKPKKSYYQKLGKGCMKKHESQISCCMESVVAMKVAGARLARGGCKRNQLKCKGSYVWCKTGRSSQVSRRGPAPRPRHRRSRKAKKERIRLFQSELVLGASGEVRQEAGKVQTDGRTAAGHRFRVKLERGRKRCKGNDPRGNVNSIVATLDGQVVAKLEAVSHGCWQRKKLYLPDGVELQGKRLVIEAKGRPGGVVRAWLDAYPRDKPIAKPPRPPKPPRELPPMASDPAAVARAKKWLPGKWEPNLDASINGVAPEERDQMKLVMAVMQGSSFTFRGDGKLTVKGNNIKFSGQLSESSSSGSVETKEFSKTDTWRVVAASGEKIRLGVPGRDGKEKQGDILKLGKDRAALLLNGRRIIFDRK